MTVYVIVVLLAIGGGVYIGLDVIRTQPVVRPVDGWVYFLSPGKWDEEKPAPVKIGMTHRDPAVDRLPEIETMSPMPLKLLYSYHTDTPQADEQRIHADLAQYRLHGEWFERYPTLAYIDNLRDGS